MIIHVVQPGETAYSIADKYGKNVDDIIRENGLREPSNLVVGQTIVIAFPDQTYIVQEGDSLSGIAEQYNTTVMQLLRNNPFLINREYIYPGETLVIRFKDEKLRTITTFGYVFPYVAMETLRLYLPYLTYLTIDSYSFNSDGELDDINDEEIIQLAKAYDTAPVMTVSSFDIDVRIVQRLLNNTDLQNTLIEEIIDVVRLKGYYAVNIDFYYIFPNDRQAFVNFFIELKSRLREINAPLFVSLTISTFEFESGILNRGYDFEAIGAIADSVLVISHDYYGTSYCILGYFTSFSKIQRLFEVIRNQIPHDKIIIELQTIGYYVQLPCIEGVSLASSISIGNAIELARQENAVISFDPINQVSSFSFVNTNEYVVVFFDERLAEYYAQVIDIQGLQGVAIWNVMFQPIRALFLFNVLFDIYKFDL